MFTEHQLYLRPLSVAIAASLAVAAAVAQPAQVPAAQAATPAAPVVQAAPVAASGPILSAGLVAASPLVAKLSEVQRAELEKATAERLAKLNGKGAGSAAAAAAAASAPSAPKVVRVIAPPPPPPDTSKKVLSIFGPAGHESAEIQLPDGEIVQAKPGTSRGNWKVVAVSNAGVTVEVSRAVEVLPATPSGKRPTGEQVRRAKHGAQTLAAKEAPAPVAPDKQRLTIAVGSAFR